MKKNVKIGPVKKEKKLQKVKHIALLASLPSRQNNFLKYVFILGELSYAGLPVLSSPYATIDNGVQQAADAGCWLP